MTIKVPQDTTNYVLLVKVRDKYGNISYHRYIIDPEDMQITPEFDYQFNEPKIIAYEFIDDQTLAGELLSKMTQSQVAGFPRPR